MAFEEYNYDIIDKLPEWWKDDPLLTPINKFTQDLLGLIIGSILSRISVVQPVQVWKTLPEEYNWLHQYFSTDPYLYNQPNIIYKDQPATAIVPNTKRNCHAAISIRLQGQKQELADNHTKMADFIDFTLSNGSQHIEFTHIPSTSTIFISTIDNTILINDELHPDLVEGHFDKIQPVPKNLNYDEVDIDDENKKTEIILSSSSLKDDEEIVFDMSIELLNPVYTTEQHIELHSVSAFPIEKVDMFGFYCNQFNNKEGYQHVWTKEYPDDTRTVYDKINTQFDFERFFIGVKYRGLSIPLFFGFPQEELSSSPVFQTNQQLDKWGKVYGLPRRYYRDNISDDEEPYTFPKYYKYSVEQDYWYQQRMVNEYKYNEDAINAAFLKDTDLNNVAMIESIDPSINDVWIYTDTIKSKGVTSKDTGKIIPHYVKEVEDDGDLGISWEYPKAITQDNLISKPLTLEPYNTDSMNTYSYRTRTLKLKFPIPEIPTNSTITGIELTLRAENSIHSESFTLDDRSIMLLPYFVEIDNINQSSTLSQYLEKEAVQNYHSVKKIPINGDDIHWKKGKQTYTIGGKNYLFQEDKITKEQLGKELEFRLAFSNLNDFLQDIFLLHTVTLTIYYDIIPDQFSINALIDNKDIIIGDGQNPPYNTSLQIKVANEGKTAIKDKTLLIVVPPELSIYTGDTPTSSNQLSYDFNLDINESFIIGEKKEDHITISLGQENNFDELTKLTGYYDILILCDDKVIKEEILVRRGISQEKSPNRFAYTISLDTSPQQCIVDDIIECTAIVKDQYGDPYYGDSDKDKVDFYINNVLQTSIQLNEEGKAVAEIPVPFSGQNMFTARYGTITSDKNIVVTQKHFTSLTWDDNLNEGIIFERDSDGYLSGTLKSKDPKDDTEQVILDGVVLLQQDGQIIQDNIITDKNGKFEIKIPTNVVGQFNYKVIFKQTNEYQEANSKEIIVNIQPPSCATINLESDKTMLSYVDQDVAILTANVYDDNNQPIANISVDFYINNILLQTATTNDQGIAMIQYNSTKSGIIEFYATNNNIISNIITIEDYILYDSLTTDNNKYTLTKGNGIFDFTSTGLMVQGTIRTDTFWYRSDELPQTDYTIKVDYIDWSEEGHDSWISDFGVEGMFIGVQPQEKNIAVYMKSNNNWLPDQSITMLQDFEKNTTLTIKVSGEEFKTIEVYYNDDLYFTLNNVEATGQQFFKTYENRMSVFKNLRIY